jgi:Kef-type K+ transport system membrane component KefB
LWMGLALLASLASIRLGVSIALTEILVGVVGGNYLGLRPNDWINWLGGFGAVLLTFLAGADIDPESMRRWWKESLVLGLIGFLAPFLGALAFAYYVAHWTLPASEIAGVALSTTSVAVVYAVMVETGLNATPIGKLILAACFVNDLGTVIALGILFANFNGWMWLFLGATVAVCAAFPRVAPRLFGRYGRQVSQPEIKLLFVLLFALGGLASLAQSEPVLPAYVLGLAAADVLLRHRQFMERMRVITFTLLTPFYFLKAGLFVLLPAVAANAALVAALFGVKMVAKIVGIGPATRLLRFDPREGNYTTLLMATGLTFGTISSLFGLSHHIIDQTQYTILVTVVIMSAVLPTMAAQALFRPQVAPPAVRLAEPAEEGD